MRGGGPCRRPWWGYDDAGMDADLHHGRPQGPIHFTLGSPFCGGERSQRVEHHDKVEKLLLRLKRGRRGQVALLWLVFVVDLFYLTAGCSHNAGRPNPPRPLPAPGAPPRPPPPPLLPARAPSPP